MLMTRRLPAPCLALALALAAISTGGAAQETRDSSSASAARRSPFAVLGARTITIFPDSLPDVPRSMTELLAIGAPGVFVQHSSGALGSGAWISIRDGAAVRGAEPLVIVDGVRTVAILPRPAQALERRTLSRVDEIPVEQIERVEILPGPAAAARYGREARAGVIEITTRRPGRGVPRLRASLSAGSVASGDRFPRNSTRIGTGGYVCAAGDASGGCSSAVPSTYTPLLDASPFRTSAGRRASASASGGLAGIGYAVDVTHERTAGVLDADGRDLTTGGARLAFPVFSFGRVELVSRATARGATLPFEGYSSIVTQGLRGAVDCSPATPCNTDTVSRGYGAGSPDQLASRGMKHRAQHFTNAATFVADPLPWLALRTQASTDNAGDRGGFQTISPASSYTLANDERGVHDVLGQEAVVRRTLGAWELTTGLSFRAEHERAHAFTKQTQMAESPMGPTYSISSRWTGLDFRRQTTTIAPRLSGPRGTLGASVGSVRWRGPNAKENPVLTPATRDASADFSYLVARRPERSLLRDFVVRGALGQVAAYETSNDPFSTIGFAPFVDENLHVHADRTYEGELGTDLVLAPAGARLSVTAFRRRETDRGMFDGSYPEPVYCSGILCGYGPRRYPPLRRVVNGAELALRTTPLTRGTTRLEANLAFTVQSDRVVSESGYFGPFSPGLTENGRLSVGRGKSFASWDAFHMTFVDANGNGVFDAGEAQPVSDGYVGRMRPSRFGSLDTRLAFGRSTLGVVLAYQGGNKVLDKVETLRCRVRICDAVQSTAIDDRLYVAAAGGTPYLVSGEALRVSEVSLQQGIPLFARLAHAGEARLTIAARNVATFSHARYLDAETELPAPGFTDTAVQPPGLALARTIVVRLSTSY